MGFEMRQMPDVTFPANKQARIMNGIASTLDSMSVDKDWQGIVDLLSELRMSKAHDPVATEKITLDIADHYGKLWQWDKAAEEYESVLKKNKDHYGAMYALSICQLHLGNIKDGFYNYGLRWATGEMQKHMVQMLTKGVPYLDNWKKLKNKRVFVSGEQGMGDEIMFGRVMAEAQTKAKSLFKLTPEPLLSLFQNNYTSVEHASTVDKEVSRKDFIKDKFDYIISIGDLFRLFVLEHDAVPPVVPFSGTTPIQLPEKRRTARWVIGYCDETGTNGDTWEYRRVKDHNFRILANQSEMYQLNPNGVVPKWAKKMPDEVLTFLDTANVLTSLDAVVSVDTSSAHLALSMGKKTVLVYDRYLDWRWKVGMYPAVKIVSTYRNGYAKEIHDYLK